MQPPEIGVLHRLVALDLIRGAVGQEPALVEYRDPLRELEYSIHVMLDDQQRAGLAVSLRDLTDQRARRDTLGRAHPGQRLVQQQHIRPGGERDADLQTSLLAIR